MNLQTWCNIKKLEIVDLANQVKTALGLKKAPYETVRTHLRGTRKPKDEMMRAYFEISGGEVTPNDFASFYSLKQLKTKVNKEI